MIHSNVPIQLVGGGTWSHGDDVADSVVAESREGLGEGEWVWRTQQEAVHTCSR